MTKKLKLKPSARDRRRYFLANASNSKIEKAILEYIGILGFAKSNYMFVKKFGENTIGSCSTKALEEIRASLAFKKIKIEKVSGTIRAMGTKTLKNDH